MQSHVTTTVCVSICDEKERERQRQRQRDRERMFTHTHTHTHTLQTKFYPMTSGSHLTWGTEVKQIQLEGRGEIGGEATQRLTPTNITFL